MLEAACFPLQLFLPVPACGVLAHEEPGLAICPANVHADSCRTGSYQHMLEGSSEPTVCVVFSPRKADEVKHAVRVIERFVAFNAELFELVEELQGLCSV